MTRLPILCVDDEPRILESIENHLAFEYDVTTSTSPVEALKILAERPHAVVLSDMRMPGMSGATFLGQVREAHPDTVRMLLTGQADLHDAAAAVNSGNLFRFLLKPCETSQLLAAVADAYRQYDLLVAERTLLEQTLNGAVTVLTDILSVIHPLAFGRANRAAALVKYALPSLKIANAWQVELAAMLSQLGCITFDAELIEHAHAGAMTHEESTAYQKHPDAARKMIERIPRLGAVADIVGDQLACTTTHASPDEALGCQLVRAALLIDQERGKTKFFEEAAQKVLGKGPWDPRLAAAVHGYRASNERRTTRVSGKDLAAEMVLESDATSPRGELWMTRGTELTPVAAKRLRALAERGMLVEPVLVSVLAS